MQFVSVLYPTSLARTCVLEVVVQTFQRHQIASRFGLFYYCQKKTGMWLNVIIISFAVFLSISLLGDPSDGPFDLVIWGVEDGMAVGSVVMEISCHCPRANLFRLKHE